MSANLRWIVTAVDEIDLETRRIEVFASRIIHFLWKLMFVIPPLSMPVMLFFRVLKNHFLQKVKPADYFIQLLTQILHVQSGFHFSA
jgi:hypothetical protein